MKKAKHPEAENDNSLHLPSASGLRGRQSVRATFKLTEKAINALSIVSVHLGIKQKSLFDHLIEDTQALDIIAREIKSRQLKRLPRVQKTYVLSRKTLSSLDQTSKSYDAPRDALVEYSIQRLLPIIEKEREKHRKRKEILADITAYMRQGEKILRKSKELLGEDDPVCERFQNAMIAGINAYNDIENYVEKGKIIENF